MPEHKTHCVANAGGCSDPRCAREGVCLEDALGAAERGRPAGAQPPNPKQTFGDMKVPAHLFPTTAIVLGSMAFLEGREKYGQDNFRGSPVEAMTYIRALLGHTMSYMEGQDNDPDSGLPELAKMVACVAILIDATYAGTLIDNRKFPGGYQRAIADMQPHVARLRAMHADKRPLHYTIGVAKPAGPVGSKGETK